MAETSDTDDPEIQILDDKMAGSSSGDEIIIGRHAGHRSYKWEVLGGRIIRLCWVTFLLRAKRKANFANLLRYKNNIAA